MTRATSDHMTDVSDAAYVAMIASSLVRDLRGIAHAARIEYERVALSSESSHGNIEAARQSLEYTTAIMEAAAGRADKASAALRRTLEMAARARVAVCTDGMAPAAEPIGPAVQERPA